MKADSKSSYNYKVQGDPSWTKISREFPCDHCGQFESDARAAYLNALMWAVTGDSRHAEKAVRILNTWSSLTNFYGGEQSAALLQFFEGGTTALSAGIYGAPIINAAEIMKSTYTGWAQADIEKFKSMLVHPGYSNTAVPVEDIADNNVTFYWRVYMIDPPRHGNQELAAIRTLMAIGIFLDNEIIYDRALRYIKGLPHRPDDLPYAPGPRTSGTVKSQNEYFIFYNYIKESSIPDYGYDGVLTNYIYDNGQCQESSRDQQHTMLGLGFISEISEMAWNQGDNLYGWADNRLLKGMEYTLRYNVSFKNSYPDQPVPWEPSAPGDFYQATSRSACWKALNINPKGRGGFSIRPTWEMALNHYWLRMNIPEDSLKWLRRARDKAVEQSGYEKSGFKLDTPGWGGLTYRRPADCQGDPCTAFINGQPVYGLHILPGTIALQNYDYFPVSAGGGEGKTFHDISGSGFSLTDLEPGEWVNYTVYVPEDAAYRIIVQYASGNGNGRIKFSFAGEDATDEVAVPYGAPHSTGLQDWKQFIAADGVGLRAGVQSMRVYILGTEPAFALSRVNVQNSNSAGVLRPDQINGQNQDVFLPGSGLPGRQYQVHYSPQHQEGQPLKTYDAKGKLQDQPFHKW